MNGTGTGNLAIMATRKAIVPKKIARIAVVRLCANCVNVDSIARKPRSPISGQLAASAIEKVRTNQLSNTNQTPRLDVWTEARASHALLVVEIIGLPRHPVYSNARRFRKLPAKTVAC